MKKPKTNYRSGLSQLRAKDLFQTPGYALAPLLPYLAPFGEVWEPAAGEGYLARALSRAGKRVLASDYQMGFDFSVIEFISRIGGCTLDETLIVAPAEAAAPSDLVFRARNVCIEEGTRGWKSYSRMPRGARSKSGTRCCTS